MPVRLMLTLTLIVFSSIAHAQENSEEEITVNGQKIETFHYQTTEKPYSGYFKHNNSTRVKKINLIAAIEISESKKAEILVGNFLPA